MPLSLAVRVHSSAEGLARENQLAWKIAELATSTHPVDDRAQDMVSNRVVDNAAVAMAALNRESVVAARDQTLSHSPSAGGKGSTLFGIDSSLRTSPEWAAWANGVAVRELDFHDTFLAADYSHPGDSIPALLAIAQHRDLDGERLVEAIAMAYEIHVSLVRSMCLHEHKIDHVAHLGVAIVGGLGRLLALNTDTVFHAIGQVLHTTTSTRQSRKGSISSWKAYAPAFAGKMAVESVDRAMRGQTSPSPIYEGEDGFIAWMLGGASVEYSITLPSAGEPLRAILDTYTKEHSAEYQAQALIDLARRLHHSHPELRNPLAVESIKIHTSHHTHFVIGTGSGDPEKFDPSASRETLDHSLPYIFAVALQDGTWHHRESYLPSRAQRDDTVALWQKISTAEDSDWTRRYHATDPAEKAFGGRVEILTTGGERIVDEIAVADAHPLGSAPFAASDYERKFLTLSGELVDPEEARRFLALTRILPRADAEDIQQLSVMSSQTKTHQTKGLF